MEVSVNLELPKVSSLDIGNDSKMTEMSVDVTIQISPRVTTPNEDRYLEVTPKRSRRSVASNLSHQLCADVWTVWKIARLKETLLGSRIDLLAQIASMTGYIYRGIIPKQHLRLLF
ncbi:hypothetical protein TNCV_2457881 [Trichonephila clavipes]|nr:hypothetical protein TNCV_2457881 [Trichonephila clavipes]